ncbi:MAG: protein BatD [Candidatus Eremiobacteraeota bacterium]|nr:protein BatD [Candidatus Eremiobacteraeota bacterium]
MVRPDKCPVVKILRMLFILTVIFVVFSGSILAADLNVSASVDRTEVSMGQEINLQIVIEGTITGGITPELPDLSAFRVYHSGTSQNITFINGRLSASFVYNYTLVPLRTGDFTIGEVLVRHGGKEYYTSPIQVRVIQGATVPIPAITTPKPAQPVPVPDRGPVTPEPDTAEKLFVTAQVDRSTAYVNQQITYIFRFYRSVNLVSRPQYQPPSFTGFFTEDLTPTRPYSTTIDGRNYVVDEIRVAIFPTAPGKYTIPPAKLLCEVQDFVNTDPWSDDFFRRFFGEGTTRELTTEPVQINVLPLPPGEPENFSGTVGKYDISARLDKNKTEVNNPVTLVISITGQGNLKTIGCPELPDMPEFRVYEPVNSLNLSKAGGIVQGSQNFSIVLVPLEKGTFKIPPIQFSYFDPDTGSYNVSSTKSLELEVLPGKHVPASITPSATGTTGPSLVEKDIRYIHTRASSAGYSPLYKSKLYIILFIFPFAVSVLVIFISIFKHQREKEADQIRRSKAFKTARIRLRRLLSGKKVMCEFLLPEISKIINEYFDDKFHVAAGGMSLEQLVSFLREHGVSEGTCSNFREIFEASDCARFGPAQLVEDSARSWLDKAMKLLEGLEKELK